MGITALLMAGGKATRMQSKVEKALLRIGNKSMLELALDALRQSKFIADIVVAVSPMAPQTAHAAKELHARVVETPGDGYESDMKYVISKLELGDTLIVSADLPFLTGQTVDRAVEEFRASRKPALSVMVPAEIYEQIGSEPQYLFKIDGKSLVPIGLNILNGRRIGEPELDETVMVVDSRELALNVNSRFDYELAKEWFEKGRKTAIDA